MTVKPDLVYFDPDYTGEYPSEPPFTISELEDIYPAASAQIQGRCGIPVSGHSNATFKLQKWLCTVYHAIWKHIMNVSLKDLKKKLWQFKCIVLTSGRARAMLQPVYSVD